jgi:hypothetical protein
MRPPPPPLPASTLQPDEAAPLTSAQQQLEAPAEEPRINLLTPTAATAHLPSTSSAGSTDLPPVSQGQVRLLLLLLLLLITTAVRA